jgi:hypothetical protein
MLLVELAYFLHDEMDMAAYISNIEFPSFDMSCCPPLLHTRNVNRHSLHAGLCAPCHIQNRTMSTICEHRDRRRCRRLSARADSLPEKTKEDTRVSGRKDAPFAIPRPLQEERGCLCTEGAHIQGTGAEGEAKAHKREMGADNEAKGRADESE